MVIKRLGEFFLAKDANAIIVAFLCALSPIFYFPTGFIAVIIVGLITLQKGAQSGLKILAWVALPTIALLVLRKFGSVDVLFFHCVVVWFLASLLHRFHAWSLVLEALALLGVVLVILAHLIVPDLQQWWIAHITQYMNEIVANAHWKMPMTPSEFAKRIGPIATGVRGFLFACAVLFDLMIARCWQSVVVNPGAFGKELVQIRLGKTAIYIAALVFLMCLCQWAPAIDAFPLVLLPFFFAGLSVLHFVARQKRQMLYVLIFVYVGLIFLPALVVLILAIIALIDIFCDVRKKFFNV